MPASGELPETHLTALGDAPRQRKRISVQGYNVTNESEQQVSRNKDAQPYTPTRRWDYSDTSTASLDCVVQDASPTSVSEGQSYMNDNHTTPLFPGLPIPIHY